MTKVKRVMVVDDSALMRKKITDMINADPELEVVATARDGKEAIRELVTFKPDVVTLDIQMPRMDGLTALGYIMTDHPTPVIMLSAYAKEDSELTMKALEYGAVDFAAKPSGPVSFDIVKIKQELIDKIRQAAETYGKKVIGVILTGMGSDGTQGLAAIKAKGGKTFVEDKSTSLVFDMPESAIQAKVADKVIPLYNIAAEIERLVRGT
jgi:two-component system chemotaxis response regulator CheB